MDLMYWIPAVSFLVHVGEEYPLFPEWATRHFGATSRAWFVYSHIPLIAGALAISSLAASPDGGGLFVFLATTLQWMLASNAVLHIATTFTFREMSPGVVTAVLLFVPGTVYVFGRTLREGLLPLSQIALAVALGSVLGIAVLASLWLHMDIDWRFCRGGGKR